MGHLLREREEFQEVRREGAAGSLDGGLLLRPEGLRIAVVDERRRVLHDLHAILTGHQAPHARLFELEASDVGGPRALVGDAARGLGACLRWRSEHAVTPDMSWGTLPAVLQKKWTAYDCDHLVQDAIQREDEEARARTVRRGWNRTAGSRYAFAADGVTFESSGGI